MKVLNQEVTDEFAIYNGDSTEVLKDIPDGSIGYSIFSPPFAELYVYSSNNRDLSNVKSKEEFYNQFDFMIKELYRVLASGRLVSFHIINLPTSKFKDGFTGLRDFRGDVIRLFEKAGFIYHSEVCIWKDAGIQMQRTKAQGLLHKTIVNDSSKSRQALADYLVTMKKPSTDNDVPISGCFTSYAGDKKITSKNEPEKGRLNRYSIDVWNSYASPVWMDINPSKTLQARSAREDKDEKHLTPTQLQVIERGIQMWSNEGDTVLDLFSGIGSVAYQSILMDRKAVAIELKETYYKQSVENCKVAVKERLQKSLF